MRTPIFFILVLSLVLGCSKRELTGATERQITILSTNDIHGGIEPTTMKDGKVLGGMALWAGVARAIRKGLTNDGKNPDVGVLTVDGGDQFQGTLLSNYDEGELLFNLMEAVKYDAVVPGNHDYDFGPLGWLDDQGPDIDKRREALLHILKQVTFPLISANTYFTATLKDGDGKPVTVDNGGCTPKNPNQKIDWNAAKRPPFVKPYVVKTVAGVKVALIGIDHPHTPSSTTKANVEDLCFGDERQHYLRAREEAKAKEGAEIFVMIVHNGDAKNDKDMSKIAEKLTAPERLVDAIVSAHTHYTYNERKNGVPMVQSGFGGISFARIDLTWDTAQKKIVRSKSIAGVRMHEKECDQYAPKFSPTLCEVTPKGVKYEGIEAAPAPDVAEKIADARKKISHLADRPMGHAHQDMTRDRIRERPLPNALTDAFREATKAHVAFLNTGGIREEIKTGDFTYEDLFKVIPFSNRAVVVGPMPKKNLISLLDRSIKTCGTYGSLMQSGLRVLFRRDCSNSEATGGIDPNAKLLRVETVDGVLVYDDAAPGEDKINPAAPDSLRVATLDFLAVGGSGFSGFQGVPEIEKLYIFREILRESFEKTPADWKGGVDGRWKNELPEENPT